MLSLLLKLPDKDGGMEFYYMKYVLVAINLPVKNLFRQFIYRLPVSLLQVGEGWRVVVPFGPQKVEGFVVRAFSREEAAAVLQKDNPDFSFAGVKEVSAALGTRPWFNDEMLRTAKWLAKYYLCSLAESMRLFIPGKTSIRRKPVYQDGKLIAYAVEERLKPKTVLAYSITEAGRAALQAGNPRAKAQMRALELLQQAVEPLDGKEAEAQHISVAALRALAEKGWALRTEKRLLRNSYDRQAERKETLQLTSEQEQAVAAIRASLDHFASPCPQEFLLQGITGSGKTEVYLRAADYALR